MDNVIAKSQTQELNSRISTLSDENFFQEVALLIQSELNTNYVLIGELIEDDLSKVKTLAFVADGEFFPSLVYSLYETPCENVVNREICYYPCNVRELFPNDKELKDLNVESYLGSPLLDKNGRSIGLIALMHRDKMSDKTGKADILENISREIAKKMANYAG